MGGEAAMSNAAASNDDLTIFYTHCGRAYRGVLMFGAGGYLLLLILSFLFLKAYRLGGWAGSQKFDSSQARFCWALDRRSCFELIV